MTFLQGLKYVHRESWAFLMMCPLIVFIPILVEFAQHVVEFQIGMYAGPEGAKTAESNPLRLQVGFAKTLALSLISYSVIRFLAGNRDVKAARQLEGSAVKLFAIVFAVQALLAFLGLFVFTGTSGAGIAYMIAGFFLGPLLARFTVAAPLGIWISPLSSIAQMARQLPFAVIFSLVAMLPLMVVHYGLGIGAIFAPGDALKWVLLILDSLIVGWLAALLAAASWVIATRRDVPEGLTSR